MLKELKTIGEYVMGKTSPIESLITIPGGDFYVINLLFDGEKFVFDEIPKKGDISDLVAMCFKPGKARSQSILPNTYLGLNDDGSLDGLHKIVGSLEQLKKLFVGSESIISAINNDKTIINLDACKQLITTIPKKDSNKKMIMIICGLQLSREYVLSLGLRPLNEEGVLYFGQVQEFQEYFISKNQGEGATLVKGFCHVCETQKNDLISFTQSTGVNFDYKFYNLDKPGFAYSINQDNGPQSFGVCQGCYTVIKTGYNYFKTLSKNVLGSKAYVFPSFGFPSIQTDKVFALIEKYSNIDQLDDNIKAKIGQGEITTDMFDVFSSQAEEAEKEIINNSFVKLNFLFGQIDGAKSDELKVKYFLKDIVPSKLGKLYASIKQFNRKFDPEKNKILSLSQNFFGKTEWLDKQYSDLSDLHIYPSYEKGKYCFNLKNFLTVSSNGDQPYYKFLDIYLHNGKYSSGEFWSLVYEKLTADFKDTYLINKKGNLKNSLREIYLVYNYLITNNLLSPPLSSMTLSFATDHAGLLAIQEYANTHRFSPDAVYIALIGMYFKLCVSKQQKEVGTSPLMTEIHFARMDYDHLIKLLNKARDKFNKYSGKKFAYYPALYRQILEMGLIINKNVSRDQMAYYFGIGMEILPNIYFNSLKNKAENIMYQTELEEASTYDETL